MYSRIITRSIHQTKIGLEVHAQLNVCSKLFSQGGNTSQAQPNSQLDLLDIALPGVLPKFSQTSLRFAIISALGLNCTIQDEISFDRKNYFYSDMPAGFQITQYNRPLAKNGYVDFIVRTHHRSQLTHSQQYDVMKHIYPRVLDFEPYIKRSKIKQIQLEQDSAKSLHEEDSYSLVDYNRSGASLIEIVFEPDLTSHHEASSLIRELIVILKALGTCECHLQEGSMRVDANISIDNYNRVELKNLNSLKALSKGIESEIQRQTSLVQNGKTIIQETRTFDTKSGKTIRLRLKEGVVDYRYVPEPSIPPLRIDQELISELSMKLPTKSSADLRNQLVNDYNMDLYLITEVMEEPGLVNYLNEMISCKNLYNANEVAEFLIYVLANLRRASNSQLHVDLDMDSEFVKLLSPEKMRTLFDMILEDQISYATAYDVIEHIFINADQSDPKRIVDNHGWHQINDESKIDQITSDAIKNSRDKCSRYAKNGQKKHLWIIMEQLRKIHGNKINVKKCIESFDRQLRPN